MVLCRVALLDGKDYQCDLDKRAEGKEILDRVFEHTSLLERDYFGLTYKGHKNLKCWLIPTKEIKKQLKEEPWDLVFEVKFYVPDPGSLREELTRYLLFLQVRRDIQSEKLPCSFLTQAMLSSYAVQSQLGDYSAEQHGDGIDYIKDLQFAPNQSEELLEKIAEIHRLHRGQTAAEAELSYLENARTLAMYGVHMHAARDIEDKPVFIGVCAMGLLIFVEKIRSNRYPWAKIIYIKYKKNHFIVRLRPPETNQKDKEKVKFKLDDVKLAKRLWRIAVEHHVFFRMQEAAAAERSMFWRSHNKFYYSGRTEYQTRLAADAIPRSGNDFNRVSGRAIGENGAPGYSTERGEQCIAEESRIATLNIRRPNQNGSRGTLPWNPEGGYEGSQADRASRTSGTTSHNRSQDVELLLGMGGGGARFNNGWGGSTGGSRAGDPQAGKYFPNQSADGGLGEFGDGFREGVMEPHYETVRDGEMAGNGFDRSGDRLNNGYDQDDWRRQMEGGRSPGGLIDGVGYDNYERRPGYGEFNPDEDDETRRRRLAAAGALVAGAGRRRSRRSSRSSSSGSSQGHGSRGERGFSPHSMDDHLREYDENYPPVRGDLEGGFGQQRDAYGNVVITKNIFINRPDRMSRLSSLDRSREGAFGRGFEDNEGWEDGNVSPNGTARVTTRTYTAPDGTVITEYRTERNGVITTRIEKRTRVTEEDTFDFDHDKALHDAIYQVTNMDPNLDVEKIEIHTKSEERYDETPDYSLV